MTRVMRSKAIYSRLFDYLISKINLALVAGGTEIRSDMQIIGIVDIFGFEVFKTNSLEQLCINFTNEKLQALFTKSVFIETLKAYEQDGISADEITYQDNKHLIELFDKPQPGLWALLSEECMVPKGSDTGFTEKLHDAQKKGNPRSPQSRASRAAAGFQIDALRGQGRILDGALARQEQGPARRRPDGADAVRGQRRPQEALHRGVGGARAGRQAEDQVEQVQGRRRHVPHAARRPLPRPRGVAAHFVRCFKPNDAKAANTGGRGRRAPAAHVGRARRAAAWRGRAIPTACSSSSSRLRLPTWRASRNRRCRPRTSARRC